RDFYQKIIDTKDFNTFEDTLTEWVKNIDKDVGSVLELMKNHEQTKILFSSIIGFFYQIGINCDVDKNEALKLYLLTFDNSNDKFLNQNFAHLHLLDENVEFDILQSMNIIIGKYLLSLFYYKDIILANINERIAESDLISET